MNAMVLGALVMLLMATLYVARLPEPPQSESLQISVHENARDTWIITLNSDGSSTCTNPQYIVELRCPPDWYIVEPGVAGSPIQIYNYDPSTVIGKGVFPPGDAKVEIGIERASGYASTPDFPEKSRTVYPTEVAGQPTMVTRIEYVNANIVTTYDVVLPTTSGRQLKITYYGDPCCRRILDEIANSIRWISS